MITLSQFLSHFSTATIQRSLNYVKKIELANLDTHLENNRLEIETQIKGTDWYDTFIRIDLTTNKITDNECSCPVGFNCKHVAALARYYYDHQYEKTLNKRTNNNANQAQENHATHYTAKAWLEQFRQQLAIEKSKKTATLPQLVYVFEPKKNSKKLQLIVNKARRTKDGHISKTEHYTSYDNVPNGRLKVSNEDKNIFNHLYFFAKLNFNNTSSYNYPSTWDISGIYQEQLKMVVQKGVCYNLNTQNPALVWSDELYQLEFDWYSHPKQQTEKLKAQFFDQNHQRLTTEHNQNIYIIHSHPLSYLDI